MMRINKTFWNFKIFILKTVYKCLSQTINDYHNI
jgi:hypothetical protein